MTSSHKIIAINPSIILIFFREKCKKKIVRFLFLECAIKIFCFPILDWLSSSNFSSCLIQINAEKPQKKTINFFQHHKFAKSTTKLN